MNDNDQHETIRPLTDQEIELIGGGSLIDDLTSTAIHIIELCGGMILKPKV
jgi:hypothetical protein